MNTKVKNLTYAALFAALTTVMTAYVMVPVGNGYVHFGDSIIYLAASLLPAPFAIAAGALGGLFADLLAGAAIWAPFTFVIKALLPIPFILLAKNRGEKKMLSLVAPLFAGLITIVGYYIAEGILFSFTSALAAIPGSIIQAVGSAIVYYIIAAAFDRTGLAKKI